ncbi:MAG: hypothetical protein KatS3mg121_0250 [Gammaproteobacteria bacterium]|nr:MAG: hypothetical protein KatS3mg121_0250 [Gammaproteobacteria bacterium]
MRALSTALLLSLAATTAGAGGAPLRGVWEPRELEFAYLGVVTHYSCEAIEARLAKLLRRLGARNVEVDPAPCFYDGSVQGMYKLRARYEVLRPAPAAAAEGTVAAAPGKVVIDRNTLGLISDNDCELIERFVRYGLPKTDWDVLGGKVGCNATRSAVLGKLELETLLPIDEAGS